MLKQEFLGNTFGYYLLSLAAFLAVLLGFVLARRDLASRLRSLAQAAATDVDELVGELFGKIRLPECVLLALWMATRHLHLPVLINRLLHALLLVVLTYRVVTMIQVAANHALRRMLASRGGGSAADKGTMRSFSYLVSGLLWFLAALFVLSNLGFNVSSMLAGLGIGGVAVALAAQAILGDLFSAFAIYLDRPFVVGDFIVVDALMGTVEHIGIKTTRVRALSGEMLVIANSKLTSSQIQNFRQLQERRIALAVGVPYQISEEQVKKIPEILRRAVASAPKARFDRAHLKSFGETGFSFELVYFVVDPSYVVYMDVNEAIHLSILQAFRREGIDFALPTRTLLHRTP